MHLERDGLLHFLQLQERRRRVIENAHQNAGGNHEVSLCVHLVCVTHVYPVPRPCVKARPRVSRSASVPSHPAASVGMPSRPSGHSSASPSKWAVVRETVARGLPSPRSPRTSENGLVENSQGAAAGTYTAFSEKNAERRAAEKEVAQLRQQCDERAKNYTVELTCVWHGLIALVILLLRDVAARFVFTSLCSSFLLVRFLAPFGFSF
jgi:hypothetical protein